MSGWTALNLEPEDNLSDVVDDTKEIQLEEAFKLYQTALKLHSQGPAYFDATQEAYDELFRSEVFKYPEATSDFDHDQSDDVLPASQVPSIEAIIPVSLGAAADTANSLPQLIYLSYKSKAQFLIDRTYAFYNQLSEESQPAPFGYYGSACLQSLKSAAVALECDDTDLDLWKRASRVSAVLNTVRIIRFCLESVLAGDEEGEGDVDLSGLDEAFAQGELQNVLRTLDDSLVIAPKPSTQPKTDLLEILKQSNDPYPFLPQKSSSLEYFQDAKRPLFFMPVETQLQLTSLSQLSIAQALLQTITAQGSRAPDLGIAGKVRIRLPLSVQHSDTDSTRSPKAQDNQASTPAVKSSTSIADDVAMESPASFHSLPDETEPAMQTPHTVDANPSPQDDAPTHTNTSESIIRPELPIEAVTLPSRKRSSTAAGNEEPEARAKSKRIKARESLVGVTTHEEDIVQDPSYLNPERMGTIESADDVTFATVNRILEQIDHPGLGSLDDLRDGLNEDNQDVSSESRSFGFKPTCTLKHILMTWNDEKSGAFSAGHGGRDHIEKSTGLSLFLKHSKPAVAKEAAMSMTENENQLATFIHDVNLKAINYSETLFLWLKQLLVDSASSQHLPPYLQGLWNTEFREVLDQIITAANSLIVSTFEQYKTISIMQGDGLGDKSTLSPLTVRKTAEFAQAMFEMHLDIYSEFTNPASTIDERLRQQQGERLETWAQLVTDAIQYMYGEASISHDDMDSLILRFLWASITFAQMSDSVDKSHVLLCLNDLQNLLSSSRVDEIVLPNNVAMPVISAAAVEQEISKLRTLEFFMSVFDTDNSEAEAVITKLEPVLEYGRDKETWSESLSRKDKDEIENFQSFLSTGDASLTLFLWKRLQNAYTSISYNTKVISCLFRSIETITSEIHSLRSSETNTTEHEVSLLRWLRDVDDLIAKVLGRIADDKTAFECIDEHHLKSSLKAIVLLLQFVYEFVLTDDSLRLGLSTPPSFRTATAAKNFEKCRDRFREMFVRLWTLLYHMVKEATVQIGTAFNHPEAELISLLRTVHASLGERQYCKHCNKLFVRLTKSELFSFSSEQDLSGDIAQVVYDLYGIKLASDSTNIDHGCSAEALEKDKRTAHTLVPIIMDYAKRCQIKDLLKSDLKGTIDRIQGALGQTKPSTAVSFNRRAVSAYLKSLINPQSLFQSLRGIGEIGTKTIHTEFAHIAAQGWYLLLGNLTLAKYKSVKRVNPTPTDDLDNAQSFLRQDIEYGTSSWESWYRLAQVYDAKIEDNLIWNSQKLNDARGELATLERNAINAYTMAVAMAMRAEDADAAVKERISDMLFEFATRLYSSSRPPLDMEAFNTEKAVRHLSNFHDQSMSKEAMFKSMSEYSVWSFAAHLIRLSLNSGSKSWIRYYLLGKCLWKMFRSSDNGRVRKPVRVDDIMDAFSDAVEYVPKKERSADPILEPHSKLVSTVHKLHTLKAITTDQGVQYLQTTQYAKGVRINDDEEGNPHWEAYILAILKRLQNADKSGWHHRITARAARVVYDSEEGLPGALGAKYQFTQSIFTKTMTMQVWKPEHERAGRHYVYTGRYLRFFVEVLDRLRDRSNLEQVVRRIRRKTTDFINHLQIWEDTVNVYVDLLRRLGNVQPGHERGVFDNITFDEFTKQSEKLEKWAHDPETTTTYLDLLQDAIELKKLNNSLMKGSAIDDLIGDTYATMYELFVSQLPPEEQIVAKKDTLPQGTFINMTSETAPTGDDTLDRMRLNNLLSGQVDGASPDPIQLGPTMPGLGIVTPGVGVMNGTPPPSEAVRVPAPSKPGRTKTITKREVQKKAEAAIVKPPPIKTPTLTKRLIVNVPSIKRDDGSDAGNEDGDGIGRYQAGVHSGFSSRRGSVSMRNSMDPDAVDEDDGGDGDNEDEADEENDNSDAEELEQTSVKKRLFPGLSNAGVRNADEEDVDEEEAADSDEDRMTQGEEDEETSKVEIPDSQEGMELDGMDSAGMPGS